MMKKYFISMVGCVLYATLCVGQDAGVKIGGVGLDAGVKSGGVGLDAGAKCGGIGLDAGVKSGDVGLDAGVKGAVGNTWKFRSDEHVGIVCGEVGVYGLVETVNGLYRGPWFLGLGTGLDYYRYRSVPLFLSVTRDLAGAPQTGKLYVLANGGINLPWYDQNPLPFGVISSKFYPGVWWNGGLGYRARLSPKTDKAVLFSVSYGFKKLTEHQKGQPVCGGCMMPEIQNPPTNDYEYLNRVMLLSVGFQF